MHGFSFNQLLKHLWTRSSRVSFHERDRASNTATVLARPCYEYIPWLLYYKYYAIENLLKVTGVAMKDVDLIEINEAFVAQTLSCAKALKLDMEKLNVNGGATALGHPLGASGSRITAHLVHELRRRGLKRAIGSACIGGGQGIAIMIEAV